MDARVSMWACAGPFLMASLLPLTSGTAGASDPFAAWNVGGDWYSAENARLDTWNEKRLIGDQGEGVLINGRIGKAQSLATKRRDYRDVEVHVEFMVAKGSNSGIIFHGNYEIQILDSAHVKEVTGAHCGGIYPRAAEKPIYHHIDKGSPPRVNAAGKPGEWQSMDIIFQSPRFDENGNKTADARFAKVVHNGHAIQENVEVPYACGPNWNRKQHPQGPVVIQGDYGLIAIRNVRVKDWARNTEHLLNVPPTGFTALFNGEDLSGWHTVKLTMQGRTFSAEYDGEVLHDNFKYHDWMINMEPAPIRLQKHIVVHGDNLGATNACPIEYRNIFIKELDPPAAQRPNVVILLADDLGWQDLGCYGGPVKTPALDALAAQGVRFTDFHAGCAVCSPSRATLLTGRQHIRTGVYHVLQDATHNAHLLEREVTIAETLKQAGYATAHFGKWHLGLTSGNRKKPSPSEHGFDYWFGLANGAGPSQKDPVNFIRNGKRVGPLKGYSCQLVVDDAVQWLSERHSPDRSFFLNIWFNEPHSVLAAPDEIVSRYGGLKDQAALYSGAVENTDRAIARLVATLKELDALENTLIIYSSDNGSYREDRNGGLRGAKGSNFEGGIRSPGIFYWPRGIAGGRVEHEPAGAVDLLPTICGLAGIDKPKGVHLDGADLAPLLTGRGEFLRPQPLFWYLPTSYPAAMIRDGRHAFAAYRNYELPQDHRAMAALLKQIEEIVGKDGAGSGEGNLRNRVFNSQFETPEANRLRIQYVQLNTFQESWIPLIKAGGFGRFGLYDLDADPRQQKDISAQQPEVAARLKRQLLTLNASVMADAPDWLTPEEIAAEKTRLAAPAEPLPDSPNAELLARVDHNNLPDGYVPAKHQEYVDRRIAGLSGAQRARIGQLWKEKQRLDPNMPNRGKSFVRIMEYVAGHER